MSQTLEVTRGLTLLTGSLSESIRRYAVSADSCGMAADWELIMSPRKMSSRPDAGHTGAPQDSARAAAAGASPKPVASP
jgi:hypothetical protein